MDRRSFLLEMRKNGTLKGLKPCFVHVKREAGSLIEKNGEFVMSFRDGVFYFQKINTLFSMLRPKDDFEIHAGEYLAYKLNELKVRNVFYLYKENGDFISFMYQTGTRESFSTEDNMRRIIKLLSEMNLKKMEAAKNA